MAYHASLAYEPARSEVPEELENQRADELELIEADTEVPPQAVVRRGGTFESFKHRDFTLFWSGSLISNMGSWMQNYALAIVVYSLRRSELDSGMVNFVAGIPILLLSLPGRRARRPRREAPPSHLVPVGHARARRSRSAGST